MRRARIRPHADQDLNRQYAYLVEEASIAIAERFLHAVYEALDRLVSIPGIGSPQEHRAPRLKGLRMWSVPGFRDYLVYYVDDPDEGIEVIRVLHGARDIERMLEKEDSA